MSAQTQRTLKHLSGPFPLVLCVAGRGCSFEGSVLGHMAPDVMLSFLVSGLVLTLLLTVSPHYGSTSWSRASVARRGWASGSEDPKVALFGETHGDRYARAQDHPQWSSVVGKVCALETVLSYRSYIKV